MNHYVSDELESLARQLKRQAQAARENEEQLNKLASEDHVEARLVAEKRATELEGELAKAKEKIEDLRDQVAGQTKQLQGIRAALNAKGRNPLTDHAHTIFQTLASALPDHPLVKREPGSMPEKAALSRTDLRFIYACLEVARESMGRRGCNDWIVTDPDKATLRFMQRVENYVAEDGGMLEARKIEVKNRDAHGPGDWLVAAYLQKLMKEVYGADTFEGCDSLGI